MKIKTTLFLLLFTSLHLFSQGNFEKELDTFNKIIVSGNFNVQIIESEQEKIVVKVENYDIKNISAEAKEGVLNLKHKPVLNTKFKIYVFIYYKELNDIVLHAGSLVHNSKELNSDTLNIKVSSGSETDLIVKTEKLDLNSSIAGTLKIKGSAESLNLKANSGGIIHASSLKVDSADVKISNGSVVHLDVHKFLKAKILSKAYLDSKGDPEKKEIETRFGGSYKINN